MIYEVTIAGSTRRVSVRQRRSGGWLVRVDDGPERVIDGRSPLPDVLSLVVEGRSYEASLAALDEGWEVNLLGRSYPCRVVDPRRAALKLGGGGGEGTLTTSMPGRVVRLLVEVGAAVSAGTPLLVIEAMKMENELRAPIDGVVAAIEVSEGEALEAGARLLHIEPAGEVG